jgi:phage shock protein PspC (stress-responsive transcriptional regulator)
MYCTHCGTQNQEIDNFCCHCGRETPRANAQQAPRRLYRLAYDKKIAGVCSGIAKYLDVDVTLVRILVITIMILSGGVGFLAYIAAWIIMPVDRGLPPMRASTEARATS